MAISMPFPERISQSLTRVAKQRLNSAQFGGGYVQQQADGLNSLYEELSSISWTNMTLGERNTIIAALKGSATDYLEWTPADDGETKRYIVMPNNDAVLYQETQVAGRLYTITTQLLQVRG